MQTGRPRKLETSPATLPNRFDWQWDAATAQLKLSGRRLDRIRIRASPFVTDPGTPIPMQWDAVTKALKDTGYPLDRIRITNAELAASEPCAQNASNAL